MWNRIVYGLCFIFFIAGCSESATPVQNDFLNYVNEELEPIGELEEQTLTRLHSVTGSNYTNDETLKQALEEEILPTYRKAVDKLQIIQPETKKLQGLHQQYLEGAKKQLNGFEDAVEALKRKDQALMDSSNRQIADAQATINEYKKGMEKLAEEHNIDYTVEGLE
ncbi:hypothetical protein [Halobacillus ihumii]|uniref:hypothetical protein n=1 Tax=Halobacillus ihumii TaxID=2686092 RepID=UPI0013D82744|nr:hypothetical protein [Halobacillus ihumii]